MMKLGAGSSVVNCRKESHRPRCDTNVFIELKLPLRKDICALGISFTFDSLARSVNVSYSFGATNVVGVTGARWIKRSLSKNYLLYFLT